MGKLSVVISAYNEEEKIKECLESITFADEVILVDNESNDKTVEIASSFKNVKIFSRPNNPLMLNLNKNWGFEKASHEWILSLDADERVTSELGEEIKECLRETELADEKKRPDGYLIPRRNIIFGKEMRGGIWNPDYVLRLFREGKGRFPGVHNHELLEVEGEVGKLEGHILHLNYESVNQYLEKMRRQYLDNEVKVFLETGKKVYWYDAFRMPTEDFLKNFFVRKGYLDGLHGLVLSIFQSFYMFLVFANVWERQGFWQYNKKKGEFVKEMKSELEKFGKDLRYWYLTGRINDEENMLRRLTYKLVRRLLR